MNLYKWNECDVRKIGIGPFHEHCEYYKDLN